MTQPNQTNPQIIVSIRCTVFNHEPYLRQCLNGFVMQKTNFKYEAIVHDDASTDGSAKIIQEYAQKYPEIIKPIYEKENQFSKKDGSLNKIMNANMHGKYIAFCEGDDYWTDPLKLQKQVDFLESNPSFGMCYTDFNIYYHNKDQTLHSCFHSNPKRFPNTYSIKEWLCKTGYIAPMTWVVKKELWEKATEQEIPTPDGTFLYFAYFLLYSKVNCMCNETTATYRIVQGSETHASSITKKYYRYKGLHQVQIKLIQLFLNGQDQIDAMNFINQKFYKMGLKLFVLMNDVEEIKQSTKWLKTKKLTTRILLFISKVTPLRIIYSHLYKNIIKFRYRNPH